jgi:hypothetical protein
MGYTGGLEWPVLILEILTNIKYGSYVPLPYLWAGAGNPAGNADGAAAEAGSLHCQVQRDVRKGKPDFPQLTS